MSEANLKCPLCFNKKDFKKVELGYSCPYCGLFNADIESENLLLNCPDIIDDEWRLKIRYKVKKYFLEELRKPHMCELPYVIRKDKLEEINNAINVPSLLEKIDLFMEYLGEKTNFISEKLIIDPNYLFPLFFCRNNYELEQIIQYIKEKEFIKITHNWEAISEKIFEGKIADFDDTNYRYNYYPFEKAISKINSVNDFVRVWKQKSHILFLTEKGLSYLSEKRKNILNSKQCFVAMWFNNKENSKKFIPNTDNVYFNAIKPAIENGGKYKAMRIDCLEHCDDINDRMIAEIRKSRFLLVDLTGYRGGVYWEAGFAEGLGLPVIYTCHEKWFKTNKRLGIEGIHFDINHRNIIFWNEDKIEDFKERIKNRIDAIVF